MALSIGRDIFYACCTAVNPAGVLAINPRVLQMSPACLELSFPGTVGHTPYRTRRLKELLLLGSPVLGSVLQFHVAKAEACNILAGK